MKEMEKRIVEAFPKAMEYMDIENEFWKAFSNWCDMQERMSALYKDKDEKSRDIVRKSEFYKEISQDFIDKYPMILHELQIIQIEERRAGWKAYRQPIRIWYFACWWKSGD